jgi:flagellar basal-body rod protein FlgB
MDLSKMPLFGAVKARLQWLTQRQSVLAQNIANADTPKYKARDLKPLDFGSVIKRQIQPLRLRVTSANHLKGEVRNVGEFAVGKEKKPYETAPAGNSVILEEQMNKINETAISHKIMNDLYRKNIDMIKIAIGRR